MPELLVRQKTIRATVYLNKDVISARYKRPVIVVYDDKPMPILATYIDGGTYDQEGSLIDAGFYNTVSWENLIDAEYPA
jgi:hypothetical protein